MLNNRFSDPIISVIRKGTGDSPYVEINEPLVIDNSGKVQLSEYPSEFHKVTVVGEDRDWYETTSDIPDVNSYKVDYNHKTVTFNISNVGKQLSFSYMGMGNSLISVNNIYTQTNGQVVTETLGELISSGRDALESLKDINSAIDRTEIAIVNAESATIDAQIVANQTTYIETFNLTTQYKKNNIVSYNGNSYIAKQDTIGNIPTGLPNDSFWGLMSKKGQDGVGSVSLKTQSFTATEGQTVFTLPFEYEPLANKTKVNVGGVPQTTPENYTETNSTTITLNEGVAAGTKVVVEVFSTEFDDRIAEFDLIMAEMNTAIANASTATTNANAATQTANEANQIAVESTSNLEKLVNNTKFINVYNSTTTYQKNNFVRFNGSTYISLVDNNIGNQPPANTDNSYWGLVALKGTDGQGAVSTVNNLSPDASGDITLTASDVGAYTKPVTGIPKTDLDSGVQTSLDKADTALQSVPDASTTQKGIVILNDTLTSESTNEALTANQGKVLDSKINVLSQDLGTVTNLSTIDKSDVVAGVNEVNSSLTTHINDSDSHVTPTDKSNWNNKQDALPIENRRKITFGTAEPTGGEDGDIYFQYE